jgi:hypothetical protein
MVVVHLRPIAPRSERDGRALPDWLGRPWRLRALAETRVGRTPRRQGWACGSAAICSIAATARFSPSSARAAVPKAAARARNPGSRQA